MEKTMCVAKALYDMYFERYGVRMDEMKMHKLMYFSQRESLMSRNKPLFDGTFYGWKYGPVLKEVRSEYKFETYFSSVVEGVNGTTQKLLKEVLDEEFSWKKARVGLASGEDGDVALSLDAMKIDATKELVARKKAFA